MADESIGGVSVSITGDASGLGPAFTAAQSQAQQAGVKVAESFNVAATGADKTTAAIEALANVIRQESSAASLAAQRNLETALAFRAEGESANAAAQGIARQNTALHGSISEIQATSGALRTLSGEGGIRAAERFLATTAGLGPVLQSIFPVIGALAFVELLARMGEHIGKFVGLWGGVTEAEKKTTDQANALDREIAQIAADIQKLDNATFGSIYGEAALKAREADQAAQGLLHANNNVAASYVQIAAKLKTIDPAQIGAKTRDVITSGHATFVQQLTDINEIRKAMDALEAHAAHPLTGGSLKNTEKEVEVLREGLLKAELQVEQNQKQTAAAAHAANKQLLDDSIAVRNAQVAADAEKARLQAEAARKAEEELNRTLEQHRRQLEAFEAELRAYAQAKRAQDELNEAAQKFYDTNRKLADETAKVAANIRLGGVELANKSSEALSGQRPPTRGEQERQEPVNQPALQRLQGGNAVQQQLALAIQLKQVGIETNSEIQSRIGTLQLELAAAQKTNVPIETRLKLEQEILQAKIAQAVANGQGDQTDKLAAAQNQIQQTLVQWKSLNFGDIAQSSTKAVIAGVDGISQAMARAIVQGKNFGQAVTQSLKQIGTSILASAIEVGLKRILASLLGLVPGFQAVSGAQAGAAAQQKAIASASVLTAAGEAAAWGFESVMAALPFPINVTVAPEVATAAFAQTSSFGAFAAGTDSAPGGFAMVGEKGPEIMYVPRGAQITPNHKIGSYAGGTSGARSFSSSSSTSIGELHVHAHGVSNPDAFAKAAVAAIPREIKRQTSKASPYSN